MYFTFKTCIRYTNSKRGLELQNYRSQSIVNCDLMFRGFLYYFINFCFLFYILLNFLINTKESSKTDLKLHALIARFKITRIISNLQFFNDFFLNFRYFPKYFPERFR